MSKQTKGKTKHSFIYNSLISSIAEVRQYGFDKYGSPEDWRTTNRLDHYDAALRHIRSAMEAEFNKDVEGYFDQESGLPHLAHAASNLMFLIEEVSTKSLVGTELVHLPDKND